VQERIQVLLHQLIEERVPPLDALAAEHAAISLICPFAA
jgi:hypothetical protein